jgi:tetratricopeptide (TPR) repeat protein/transcriptional regulator with XRE-family HTH domain
MEQGWAQAELGRLVHVSGTLIAKMERAERRPQPDVARALDEALHTDGELIRLAADALRSAIVVQPEILLPPELDRRTLQQVDWAVGVAGLRNLVDRYDLPEDGPIRAPGQLKSAVDLLIRARLNSRYTQLVQTIPELIPELTRALLSSSGGEQEEIAGWLVQAWRAADAVAAKLGLFDLSARLIMVMGWAATQSGDGLAMAATSYVRAETFFVSGQQKAGHLMLERAAERIDVGRSKPDQAQYGALHMRAAIAAARAGMNDQARAHLTEARSMADRVDIEGIWEGTAFGPASVRAHEVSTAVELHTPQKALAAAAGWVPPDSLPAERRSHFFVDVARAQLALGEHDSVLRTLQKAHSIAPQNIQVDQHVQETLAALADTSAANAAAAAGFRKQVAQNSGQGSLTTSRTAPVSLSLLGPAVPAVPAVSSAPSPPST